MGATLEERFWKKVQRGNETDCWLWLPKESRYGHIFHRGKMLLAHRLSWMLRHGPIPDGLWVLHRCDKQKCVNPGHLFLGNRTDNVRDSVSKGRHAAQTNPESLRLFQNGTLHPNSKLTEAQVREIRQLKGNVTEASLARKFGVSKVTIHRIQERRIWKHVASI